ncbi:probable disease resistance protein RF45 [Coffea arabica]|uniref:Probable disease resistance protein RF45 n=1 Tax=Coffea arabica TaxID=13443 RepID=A0A6P6SE06_COFAR
MSFSGMQFPFGEVVGEDQASSEEWLRLGVEEKIYASKAMSNFRKSFDCLESCQLKACSLCLSIFPENSIIKKRPLIYWWMGEGMVTKTNNRTSEEVGESVFKDLINEGFIIPICENSSPNINSCMVHPWVRRMLIVVATWKPSIGHHRALLLAGSSDSYSAMTEDTLTVFNVTEQYLGFKSDWLSKLKTVEVLQLGRWQSSVKHHMEVENENLVVDLKKKKKVEYDVSLNGLGTQTSLRYLSLRGVSRLTALPRSVLNLISLEILDLRACHSLEKLPSDVSALRNLTHLDVSECYLLESMPKGIEELSALQLSTEAVLRSFSVPPNLKKLDLRCLPITTRPNWLEPVGLISLEKLYIRGGELSSLELQDEQKWKVKILLLKYLKNLKVDKPKLHEMFPELEYLE